MVLLFFISMQSANFNVLNILNICRYFAFIHRLYSFLSASPHALMLLFNDWSFYLSVFPATYAVFEKHYITLLKGGLHGNGMS